MNPPPAGATSEPIDDAALKALQAHALFGGLTSEQLDLVVPLLQVERFGRGQEVVREGELGDRLYFIVDGAVEIMKNQAGAARRRRLAVLQAGDAFGEMELLDIQARSATVRALDDIRTLTLSNRALLQIYATNMELFCVLVLNMAREVSRRLRRMNALLASAVFSTETSRAMAKGQGRRRRSAKGAGRPSRTARPRARRPLLRES